MTGQDAAKRGEEFERLVETEWIHRIHIHEGNLIWPAEVTEAIFKFFDAAVAEALTERDAAHSQAMYDLRGQHIEANQRYAKVHADEIDERDAEIARLRKGQEVMSVVIERVRDEARREERAKLANWSHVCTLEACCIENGLHALNGSPASAPEGTK